MNKINWKDIKPEDTIFTANQKRKQPVHSFRLTGIDYEYFIKQGAKRGLTAGEAIRIAISLLREQWEKENK